MRERSDLLSPAPRILRLEIKQVKRLKEPEIKLKAVTDLALDKLIFQEAAGENLFRSDSGPEFVAEAVQDGLGLAAQRLPISSGEVPGRTATLKVLAQINAGLMRL